ncbi:MAG: hypothetical protein SGILL_004707, partial [Bacillariaceae sp.]
MTRTTTHIIIATTILSLFPCLSTTALANNNETVDVDVVFPDDPNYFESIQPNYDLPPHLWYEPDSVFYPSSALELQSFLSQHSASNNATAALSPIGGAHGSLGYAFSGFDAAVSFRNMSKIGSIDEENLQITIQAGATLGDLIQALNGTGYMTAVGTCAGVGVSGWHLGGGYSMFSKQLGLGVDNVKSMTVMLPNATEVVATPTSHPDLYWAMRGAGHQSFGWMMDVTIGLLPLDTYVYIDLERYCTPTNLTECAEIMHTWQEFFYSPQVEESDLTSYYWFFQPVDDQGNFSLQFIFGYLSDSVEAIEEMKAILDPFVQYLQDTDGHFGTSGYRIGQFADYTDLAGGTVDSYIGIESPFYEPKLGLYLERNMTVENWEVIVDAFMIQHAELQKNNPRMQPAVVVGFEAYSGDMVNKATDYNAHFQRDGTAGNLMIDLFTYTEEKPGIDQSVEDAWDAGIAFLEGLYKENDDGTSGLFDDFLYKHDGVFQAYANYKFAEYGEGDDRWPALESYYGGNVCRLVEVKKMYDPTVMFDFPQGIPVYAPEGKCGNVTESDDNSASEVSYGGKG